MGPRHELQKVWSVIGISHKVEEVWKYPCPILAGTPNHHVWKTTASLHSIAYDSIALLLVSCVQISSVFIRSPLIFRCLREMPPRLLSQEKSDSAWFLPYEHPTIVDIQYVCSIERMVASAMFFKAHDAGRLSCCSWWWSSCDIMEVIGRHHPCLATTTHDNLYDLSHLVCYCQKKRVHLKPQQLGISSGFLSRYRNQAEDLRDFQSIDRWLRAFEDLPWYQATKGDYYRPGGETPLWSWKGKWKEVTEKGNIDKHLDIVEGWEHSCRIKWLIWLC